MQLMSYTIQFRFNAIRPVFCHTLVKRKQVTFLVKEQIVPVISIDVNGISRCLT